MRPYLQHGRRHGPDGSDPIPGISSSSSRWITGYQNNISVPTGTTATQVDFTSSVYYSNDYTTFGVTASNGLTIAGSGFFIAYAYAVFQTLSTATGTCELVWNIGGFGNDETRGAASYLPASGLLGGDALVTATQGFVLSGGTSSPIALKQDSGNTATVNIQFTVVRLDTGTGDF